MDTEQHTLIERFTLAASNVLGSWWMMLAQTVLVGSWICLNVWRPGFIDDKQFDTLRLLLGLQSVYTAPLILMAQRKVSAKDRVVLHGIDTAERRAAKLRHKAAKRRERLEGKVDALLKLMKKRSRVKGRTIR